MRTFDVTLKGFDGGTDETDHLVKWVAAQNEETVQEWLDHHNLRPHVDTVTDMERPNLTFADGVNVMLDDRGDAGRGDVEYLPGKWQIVVEDFDPKEWVEQSQLASS